MVGSGEEDEGAVRGKWSRAILSGGLLSRRCFFLWPDWERTALAGRDRCVPTLPLGATREDDCPKKIGDPGATDGPVDTPSTHTVPFRSPRSEGGASRNLHPGCPRGGHEIPRLLGEIGSKSPILWHAVEEALQVRTGMGSDLGHHKRHACLRIWILLIHIPSWGFVWVRRASSSHSSVRAFLCPRHGIGALSGSEGKALCSSFGGALPQTCVTLSCLLSSMTLSSTLKIPGQPFASLPMFPKRLCELAV